MKKRGVPAGKGGFGYQKPGMAQKTKMFKKVGTKPKFKGKAQFSR